MMETTNLEPTKNEEEPTLSKTERVGHPRVFNESRMHHPPKSPPSKTEDGAPKFILPSLRPGHPPVRAQRIRAAPDRLGHAPQPKTGPIL
jgi:hypothetical protein